MSGMPMHLYLGRGKNEASRRASALARRERLFQIRQSHILHKNIKTGFNRFLSGSGAGT